MEEENNSINSVENNTENNLGGEIKPNVEQSVFSGEEVKPEASPFTAPAEPACTAEPNSTQENGFSAAVPIKVGFWSKVKSFLFMEIKVELTPKQQKIEKEINEFLLRKI